MKEEQTELTVKLKRYKYVKFGVSLGLAILLMAMPFIAYRHEMYKFYQLTFLSNLITGIFFLVVSILTICNKKVPSFLYLIVTPLLLLVCVVSIVYHFNFRDGYLFLHLLDPILVFAYYIFLTNQNTTKLWQVPFTAVLPFSYLIFAIIRGNIMGDYVYKFLNYNTYGVGNTITFVVVVLIVFSLVSVGILYLNRLIHKKFMTYAYWFYLDVKVIFAKKGQKIAKF